MFGDLAYFEAYEIPSLILNPNALDVANDCSLFSILDFDLTCYKTHMVTVLIYGRTVF